MSINFNRSIPYDINVKYLFNKESFIVKVYHIIIANKNELTCNRFRGNLKANQTNSEYNSYVYYSTNSTYFHDQNTTI